MLSPDTARLERVTTRPKSVRRVSNLESQLINIKPKLFQWEIWQFWACDVTLTAIQEHHTSLVFYRNRIIFTLHLCLSPFSYNVHSNDSQILPDLLVEKNPFILWCFVLKQFSDCRHMMFCPFTFFYHCSSEFHCDYRLYTYPRVGTLTKYFPQIVSRTHTLVLLLPSTNVCNLFLYNDVFE